MTVYWKRTILRNACVLVLMLAAAASGWAQGQYPAKPIRMVVPFAPGGVSDVVARAVAPQLGESLGQPIVIENRAGAGGVIGTEIAAKAAPDGYTLLTVFDNFVANPFLYKNAAYDPVRDFAPISLLVRSRIVLVVHPRLGAKTFEEFLRLARSRGAPLSYASAGGGTSSHLVAELFRMTAGIDLTAVHYKGGAPAVNDLLGGQVEMMMSTMSTAIAHVRSARLIAVAVTSPTRTPLLPGVPAIGETFPGFEAQSWVGFVAPAGTPRDVIARLNTVLNRMAASASLRERLEALGFEIDAGTQESFGEWIRTETAKWGRVIRERAITLE